MSTKVFVGNLSFKTREPDLAKAFEECGTVKSTNIIARGPRSLGYGFVEFEKPEDAAKSVGAMNKKEIDGRPVNVELARPRDPNAPIVPRVPRPRRQPMMRTAPQQAVAGQQPIQGQQPLQGQAFQPRAPRRFPRPPRATGAPQQAIAGQPQQPIQGQLPLQGQRAPRRFPRRPHVPRVQPTGEASKTTLFVANLPFVVDDAGLLEIFEGMNVKEAHVVTRQNGRSKGYGFVTFENEADQLRAMQTVDKSLVENREISVHPAFAQPPKPVTPAVVPAATNTTPVTPVQPTAPVTTAPVTEAKTN